MESVVLLRKLERYFMRLTRKIQSRGISSFRALAIAVFLYKQSGFSIRCNIKATSLLESLLLLCWQRAAMHAGLIDKALHYFEGMHRDYNVTADEAHYACIVDCFGRAGQLKQVYEFIRGMPVVPNACVWSALLSSCRVHGNIGLAEIAAKKLIELDPQHSGYWMLLKNIYAKSMKWSDVSQLRTAMRDNGIKKFPGYSWIEVRDSEVHRFLSADKLHTQSNQIYEALGGLTEQLMDEGYEPKIDVDFTYTE